MSKKNQSTSKKEGVIEELQDEFKAEQLFGSKTRVRLLSLLLENAERSFYVRELTRRIDAQLNSVRRELKNLIDLGIVLEVEGAIFPNESDEQKKSKPVKNDKKKFYKANTKFIFFDELRNIMKKSSVLMNKSLVQDLCQKGTIDLIFLTGRFVDEEGVPSDLLVVGDVGVKVLQKAVSDFEKQIGREVNYTYMPKEEFGYRREVKDRFLGSLLKADKIVLVNELMEPL
jgi:hypothetical protein